METFVIVATTVVAMVFTGVFEGVGRDLQKRLMATIRDKFKTSGVEKLLERAESKPIKSNIAVVEAELVTQMMEDQLFAKRLADIVSELEAVGGIDQMMASNIHASNLEAKNMLQRAKGSSITQIMGSNSEISGDIRFDNLTQEGNSNE